ncbi:lytic transglycosylase [Brevibacillus panacihumi W25]|uniref:Lytic transglycosylase n=1 Tax=Brevibacillus panacihumi W25 TaxID=1408254 RepID=V6M857_9BACL|nr:lytic transglycosylase domain-containing protein [Brevibacillus panacihumi]EST54719.1 lytic transglycosylase [Brevibacillus panacihumi W25]
MTLGKRRAWLGIALIAFFFLLNTSFVWKWMYPIKYREEIMNASRQYQVDPHLILAVIRSESSFQADRVSKKGAIGLMQIMPDTAEWIVQQGGFKPASQDYLYDPVMNIKIGTWYLQFLGNRYEGDIAKVIAAYNAGPGKVNGWLNDGQWNGRRESLEDIPYPETRMYVQRVLYYQDRYQRVYDQELH